MRSPIKWYGGKSDLASWIVKQFPDHRTYVEPFGGGASVLFAKKPAPIEVYNDLDYRVVRFFQVLRDHGEAFIKQASLFPYSEAEFHYPRRAGETIRTDVGKAVRDFVMWRQSFGGRETAWSCSKKQSRRGMAQCVSGWLSAVEGLPDVVERLREVQIFCRDALEVIQMFDSPDTLIYCDPPYVLDTRSETSRAVYTHEMTDADHRDLAHLLNVCESKIVLSGYDCELYQQYYGKWRRVEKEVPLLMRAGQSEGCGRRTEVLWMNY